MKIGFVNGGMSVSETFIHQLIRGISKKNKDTIFFCDSKPYYTDGIKYKIIPFLYKPSFFKKQINKYLPPSRTKISSWKSKQKRAVKQLSQEIKDCDILYIDYGTTAVSLYPILLKLKKKYIVHFHGFDITSALNDSYYKKQLKLIFYTATYIIAASHYIRKILILAGALNEKIHVVRYGLDLNESTVNIWPLRNSHNQKRIVFIGRLTPKKHPIALIMAFETVKKNVPNAFLDIIGNGPLFNDCIELVQRLELEDSVIFHGSKSHSDALKFLSKAHLYAQHSVTAASGDQEGFAISLAEASLFELPVVSTFHNGIPENVIAEKTGYLVNEFDFEGMADKIIELLNNPKLSEKMGKKGKEHILNLCNPQKRIETIYQLMKNAIK